MGRDHQPAGDAGRDLCAVVLSHKMQTTVEGCRGPRGCHHISMVHPEDIGIDLDVWVTVGKIRSAAPADGTD